MIERLYSSRVLVFGCGNTLFGDDGFGPAVADYLNGNCRLPEGVLVADVGTSVRDILFDLLLLPAKPEIVFIVDALSVPGRSAGEIFEIGTEDFPARKSNDYSLHQFPSVNLLSELEREAGVAVRVLAVQAGVIPDEVRPGLSAAVELAVPRAAGWVLDQLKEKP